MGRNPMRLIKFRAKDKETGKWVYGDLDTAPNMWSIVSMEGWWRVKPETVQQLVAVTADGREIYEGDRVRLSSGTVVRAALKSNLGE